MRAKYTKEEKLQYFPSASKSSQSLGYKVNIFSRSVSYQMIRGAFTNMSTKKGGGEQKLTRGDFKESKTGKLSKNG